jgi:hypothetical protein
VAVEPSAEEQERARNVVAKLRQKVPAVIFGCLLPGELQVILEPGVSMAAGPLRSIPASVAPPELRMPNTLLWIEFNERWDPVAVWARREGEAR